MVHNGGYLDCNQEEDLGCPRPKMRTLRLLHDVRRILDPSYRGWGYLFEVGWLEGPRKQVCGTGFWGFAVWERGVGASTMNCFKHLPCDNFNPPRTTRFLRANRRSCFIDLDGES